MKRLLATAILLFASAAPSIGKDAPRDHLLVAMDSGEGLVMLRVITTRTIGGFPKWETLTLHDVKAPPQRKKELRDRFSASMQSSVFAESLRPGEYTPLSLGAFAPGGFGDEIASADFPKGYRFKVEAGRLTDLGTLYYVAPYGLLPAGPFRLIQAGEHDFARSASFMLEPESAESLLQSPLGWARIPADADPGNLKRETRQLSMTLAGGARAPDGSLLYGELFGQIARRTPAGQWTWEDTGLAGAIHGAVEMGDGTVYAVAEHSTLVRRESPGHWQRIPVPVAGALPCFLSAESDGSLFTAWEDLNAITVLSYQPADTTPWRLRIRIPLDGWPKATNPIRRCAVLLSQPKVMVLDYEYSTSGYKFGYHVLDKASSTWTAYRPEEFQGWVGMFPDGTVYSLAGWAPGQDFQVADDLGKKWQKLTEVSWADRPLFRDRNEGYFMRVDNAPQPYLEKRKYSLWRTTDGGKSWARHVSLPPRVASFMLLDGKDMLFPTLDGKLLVSHDNGASVALERDSSYGQW